MTFDIQSAADLAWWKWDGRLREMIEKGRREFPATEQDLLLEAAQQAPATVLKNDLDAMTLRDWSRALILALGGRSPGDPNWCPSWLAAPVLFSLGLADRVPLLQDLPSGPEDPEYREVLRQWIERVVKLNQERRPAALLLIPETAKSITEYWKPSPEFGAIAVTPETDFEQMTVLIRFGGPDKPVLLFLDRAHNSAQSELQIRRSELSWRNKDPDSVYELTNRRESESRATPIVAPRDLDDAMTRALRHYEHAPKKAEDAGEVVSRKLELTTLSLFNNLSRLLKRLFRTRGAK